jgi:phosphatidylserine/phosphatidylglycerophosphate/cardiolipin synthase-like enzyme
MPITVKAFANADDVLVVWEPSPWSNAWVGFMVERRDDTTGQVTTLANRIPPRAGGGLVQDAGIPSSQSPFRRCLWTDHDVAGSGNVSYRVTALSSAAGGAYAPDASSASAWSAAIKTSADAGGGLSAYFNRGTLMSQTVTKFANGDTSQASLRALLDSVKIPGAAARRYLAGDALPAILGFLDEADRRHGQIRAALYEINDTELIGALKPFGSRAGVLIGNGGATKPDVAPALTGAGIDVHHRDLSHQGKSSPSVHNKFVVELDSTGQTARRVLTGSTNWTWSGLCTQLNNVLVIENPKIAARFLAQWNKLVAAGDDMPTALKASNSVPTTDSGITIYYAASNHEVEFTPVIDLIDNAQEGVLSLMFMPGQSPLLQVILDRAQKNDVYVRGVVSTVMPSTTRGNASTISGQVIKSGSNPQSFHEDVLLPVGISDQDRPTWEETEFNVKEIQGAGLKAIVHSKTIVVDPFSPGCAVITGSHNFSPSASAKNDENLVIVRGNQLLAQAYALHINGVYDAYSWRAFLASGGDANQVFKPLDGWRPGGARYQELAFWMEGIGQARVGGNQGAAVATGAGGGAARGNGAARGAGAPRRAAKPAKVQVRIKTGRKAGAAIGKIKRAVVKKTPAKLVAKAAGRAKPRKMK